MESEEDETEDETVGGDEEANDAVGSGSRVALPFRF